MIPVLALSLLFAVAAAAQPSPTGPATAKGACSPANTGNNNTFQINCGVGQEQGEALLRLLNQVLEKQIDPAQLMAKLDEIHNDVRNIKANQGWPELTSKQLAQLEASLKPLAPMTVKVLVDNAVPDSSRLARQLFSVFTKVGWPAPAPGNQVSTYNGEPPSGVFIRWGQTTSPKSIEVLVDAISTALGEKLWVMKDQPLTSDDSIEITIYWKAR
ncbi:MAG: hypothetical protein NTZ56_05040 [Acidobacteria bacterium]|nr:hypothetical protein [Acidobacteriota bacterium]